MHINTAWCLFYCLESIDAKGIENIGNAPQKKSRLVTIRQNHVVSHVVSIRVFGAVYVVSNSIFDDL